MRKTPTLPIEPSDFCSALALLSRLPLPAPPAQGGRHGARAAWAYPLAGALIGLIAGLVGLLALWCGLPPPLAALLTLAALVIVTGAMHEDGLADSIDGLWGGWTRARRLEIMKDSHIGAFGVIALILSLLCRWSALWLLFQSGGGVALAAIVTAASVSRAAMPVVMWALPPARASGLSQSAGRPTGGNCAMAAGIAAVIALSLAGWSAFGLLFWTAMAALLIAWIAHDRIGGQTGDILGAVQQIAEIAILLSILA